MSPNDQFFLNSLGIKPEEVSPADKAPGYTAVFEPCKACSRRRHRNLSTGEVFCLSCRAREQRERDRLPVSIYRPTLNREVMQIQEEVNRSYSMGFEKMDLNWPAPPPLRLPVTYKGFQVDLIDGQGWRYRMPGEHAFEQWRAADSLQDAMQKIDRLAPPESREPDEFLVENACRGCNAPCGNHRWCKSCGRDKFGNA